MIVNALCRDRLILAPLLLYAFAYLTNLTTHWATSFSQLKIPKQGNLPDAYRIIGIATRVIGYTASVAF